MPKQLTGYALLRSVCTEEEKKELIKAKRATPKLYWGSVASTPSHILATLFVWDDSPQGKIYWRNVHNKLLYLEASKGW